MPLRFLLLPAEKTRPCRHRDILGSTIYHRVLFLTCLPPAGELGAARGLWKLFVNDTVSALASMTHIY